MSLLINFPSKWQKLLEGVNEERWIDTLRNQRNPWRKLSKFAIALIQHGGWQHNARLYQQAQKSLGMLFAERHALHELEKRRKLMRQLLDAKETFHNPPDKTKALCLQAALLEDAQKKRRVEVIGAGIENRKNDCFMISVVQALRHVPKLKECLTEANSSLPIKTLFFQIIKQLDSGKTVSANLIHELRLVSMREGFTSESTSSQECALLFCQFLLEKIGFKNFEFQTAVSHGLDFPVPSLDDQRTTHNLISLPLGQAKDGTELKELLMANCIKEEVDLNAIYSSERVYLSEELLHKLDSFGKKEDRVDTLQTILLKSNQVPTMLVLGLRRFQFANHVATKLQTKIMPSPILKIATKAPDGTLSLQEYHLKALVAHTGKNVANGHYLTFVTQRNAWVEYNDARVVEHSDFRKQKRIPEDKDSLPPFDESCQNGYLFFYQKM